MNNLSNKYSTRPSLEKWLPSFPYPDAPIAGFWSPVTSTINWCEEVRFREEEPDRLYHCSRVDSGLLCDYLLGGDRQYPDESTFDVPCRETCRQNDHDTVFSVAFLGYFIVGLGSFLFHATLSCEFVLKIGQSYGNNHADTMLPVIDPMQLVDELSMIYTTSLMCYATFTYNKSRRFSNILGVCLTSLAIFITLYYHYLQDPAFHQSAYALLTSTLVFRSVYLMEKALRPSRRYSTRAKNDERLGGGVTAGERAHRERVDRRDLQTLREMWLLVICGVSVFLLGFVFWNLDNEYCSTIRVWRRQIGLPWGILLESHGWW